MRVKHHYYTSVYDSSMLQYLSSAAISYEIVLPPEAKEGHDERGILVFDLYEGTDAYEHFSFQAGIEDIRIVEYDKEELWNADWLTFSGKSMFLDLMREDTLFSDRPCCADGIARHRILAGAAFYLKKPVRWGKSHFVCSYSLGYNYLFCDDIAKNVILGNAADVSFERVFHSRTNSVLDNVYYLKINKTIPAEAVVPTGKEQVIVCPVCGKVQYDYGPDYELCINASYLESGWPICKTLDLFGSTSFLSPMNIMSHEMYAQLVDAKLTRHMDIRPIILK